MRSVILPLMLCLSTVAVAETPAAGNSIELLAKQLETGRVDGTLQWLEVGGSKTFAIFTATARIPQGGVILLHDVGAHGDSAQLIAPLRRQLAQYGWACLSVHVPSFHEQRVIPAAELTKQMQDVLGAASQWLAQKNIRPVVVLAHGASAAAAAAALSANPGEIRALVALSPRAPTSSDTPLSVPAVYKSLTIPLLDAYGERDYPLVVQAAAARAAAKHPASPAAQSAFRQMVIPGADHEYRGQEDLLTRRIVGWLRKTLAVR